MAVFSTEQRSVRFGFRHSDSAADAEGQPNGRHDAADEFSSDDELYDCELGGKHANQNRLPGRGPERFRYDDQLYLSRPDAMSKGEIPVLMTSKLKEQADELSMIKKNKMKTKENSCVQQVFSSSKNELVVVDDDYEEGPTTFNLSTTILATRATRTTAGCLWSFRSPSAWPRLFSNPASWFLSPSGCKTDGAGADASTTTPRTTVCGTFEETPPPEVDSASSAPVSPLSRSSEKTSSNTSPARPPPKLYADSMSNLLFCSSSSSRGAGSFQTHKQDDETAGYLEDSDAEEYDSDVEATAVQLDTTTSATRLLSAASPARWCFGLMAVVVLLFMYGGHAPSSSSQLGMKMVPENKCPAGLVKAGCGGQGGI